MPTKTPHRAKNAWKKDILRQTCLLRLRLQPPVPYKEIAELLLRTKPNLVKHLVRRDAPVGMMWPGLGKEVVNVDGMSLEIGQVMGWLEGWLREGVEGGERRVRECWRGNCWSSTTRLEIEVVREMVEKLRDEGGLDRRYKIIGDEELKRQVKWRERGDWRAGSEPVVVEKLPVQVDVKVEKREARDERQDSTSKDASTVPEIASSIKTQDDEYDEERIKFFEDMVNSIVDDRSIPRPVQPAPNQFLSAYEQHLQEEHLCLLKKLRDVAAFLDELVAESRELETVNQARCKDVAKENFPVYTEPLISKELPQPTSRKSDLDDERALKREVWLSRLRSAAILSEFPFNIRRVGDPEPRFTGWEDYSGDSDDETMISSNLIAAAEKAFPKYQRSETTTQGWMEWLIPNR